MIKGIGIDVVEIDRISNLITKYGDQFLYKVFTDHEIAFCNGKAIPAVHFAGRWASKEAFYKALPSNCQEYSSWKSIQILSSTNGKPRVDLCDKKLEIIIKNEGISCIHLSISHERSICSALIIME